MTFPFGTPLFVEDPAAGPWNRTATVVHLDVATDDVGIGTAAPGAKLGVVNDVVGQPVVIFDAAAGQTADILQVRDSGGVPLLVMDDTGLVGIGEAAPAVLLEVSRNDPTLFTLLRLTNDNANLNAGPALEFQASLALPAKIGAVQPGAADIDLVFHTINSNVQSEVVRFTGNGFVGIGTTTPDRALEVSGTSNNTASVRIASYGGGFSARSELQRANGTEASPTTVFAGNQLGQVAYRGYDGTSFADAALIHAVANQNWAVGSHGSRLEFQTIIDGSTTFATRMIIANDGLVTTVMGTSSSFSAVGGKANVNTTAVGNAATFPTDLMTYTLPADSLSVDGKGVKVSIWGTTAANANSKVIKLFFGATVVRQIGPSAINNKDWRIEGIVIRTGAASQDAIGTELVDNVVLNTHSEPAETAAAAIVVKAEGTSAAANDIVQQGMLVEYLN